MARNKYPEETVEKIVQTAAKLFVEQGYDNTSIQDIVDHLGGLSKGAIYHHFRSKEDIMVRVMDYIYRGQEDRFSAVLSNKSLNGMQKLRALLDASVEEPPQEDAFSASLNMVANPQLLARQVWDSVKDNATYWVLPILREGIADGSLAGLVFPEEFAEAFMLLANVWANPMVFDWTPEEVERKCRFLQHFTRSCGIAEPMISEEKVEMLVRYTRLYHKNKKRAAQAAAAQDTPPQGT